MSFNISMMACAYPEQAVTTKALRDLSPKAAWLLGDFTYYNKPWAYYGSAPGGVIYNSAPSVWKTHADMLMSAGELRRLSAMRAQGMPIYWDPDDHGWGGDNWDGSIAKAQQNDPIGGAASGGLGPPTTAEVLTHWRNGTAGHALIQSAYFDNPAWGAPNGDVNPNMTGSVAADFPVRYFSIDVGATGNVGGSLIRFIKPDCVSYKSLVSATDNSSKLMLGATQQAWLLAQIDDAIAKGFQQIVIMSTKDLFSTNNTDGWFNYGTNRDAILAAIHAKNAPVVWMCGDRHTPHAGLARTTSGDAWDVLSLCPCPAAVPLNAMNAYQQNLWWSTESSTYVFGNINVDPDGRVVRYEIRDVYDGTVLFAATVPFGSRVPTGAFEMATPRRLTV